MYSVLVLSSFAFPSPHLLLYSGTKVGTGAGRWWELERRVSGKKPQYFSIFLLPCCKWCPVLAMASSVPGFKLSLNGYPPVLFPGRSLTQGVYKYVVYFGLCSFLLLLLSLLPHRCPLLGLGFSMSIICITNPLQ